MPHHPYAKIPESLQALKLDEAAYRRLSKLEWVVTEKVHGANFCILCDGRNVEFAKRREILDPEEDFFGFQLLREELEVAALSAYLHLKPEAEVRICIYGELFGGGYPHPEVPADLRVEPVQTGVWYHPSVRFCCFDLAVDSKAGEISFLGYDALDQACAEAGLLCLPPLFRGSLTAAMQFPIGFATGLPRHFGLLELPDNLAEGVVIKPASEVWLEGSKGRYRPVLKRKLPRFAEDERFHQAQTWKAREADGGPRRVDEVFWEQEVEPLFTAARLQSAISKLGRLTARTRGRIVRELAEDVMAEIEERFPNLEPADRLQLEERLGNRAREMTR